MGYAGAGVAIASYLFLSSGLACAQEWWSAPTDLGGVAISSGPSAVADGQHRIDVFYRGLNGHLWTSWWDGGGQWWSAPTDLGGVELSSEPAAITGGPHGTDVFYRGPNNHLWTSWWPDQPGGQFWSAPVDLGGEALTSAPTAVARSAQRMDVFYRGPNNHLWTSWWPDQSGGQFWSAPADLGGISLFSAPAAAAAGQDRLDVFYRGPNDHLWTSWWPADPWLDAQTGQSAPHPAAYDLLTRGFDPDNGLPLNPNLGSQTWLSSRLADPSLCGGGRPWERPCTTQSTWIDSDRGKCVGALGGHANWGLAVYEGRVYWENHSYYLQDDDYSFALYRDDLAGVTQTDFNKKEFLHSEFNSDQTVNHFHTWYWNRLHQAVDEDAGKGGVLSGTPHPSYTRTRALFDNKEAIIMGLFGLDAAHTADQSCNGDCGAELHPVYALALHLNEQPNLNDDIWAIFVRNWGDEGYCSTGQERIEPNMPFTFSFRFNMPGAKQVSSIPAEESDPAGEHGTVFWGESDSGAVGIGWSGPQLIPNEGAIVTFNLPPSSQGGRIDGMLHLKWSVSAEAATLIPHRRTRRRVSTSLSDTGRQERAGGAEELEARTSDALAKLTPEQLADIERTWRRSAIRPSAVKLAPMAQPASTSRSREPIRVHQVSDEARQARERRLHEMLTAPAPPR
jgi:hypothetical protein